MGILKNLFRRWKNQPDSEQSQIRGLLIYENVNDVIQAETLLKKAGYDYIRVVAPPPDYRTGCDLCLEFPIIEQIGIVRTLEEHNLPPLESIHLAEDTLKPIEICKIKDFGDYLMVRAANMKLTFEKSSQKIVNISGGGCSDVPYLAQEMIGKTLSEAPSPREIGYTLCAYSLAIAFEEAKKGMEITS
jgi:hypothetical protein